MPWIVSSYFLLSLGIGFALRSASYLQRQRAASNESLTGEQAFQDT
jgi:hypothetical protein